MKWNKPPTGWVKLNTDGTMHGNLSKVDGGGVLRSSNGDWIGRFARKMGGTLSTVAELWALKDGLTMAKQMGLKIFVFRWTLSLLFSLFQGLQWLI